MITIFELLFLLGRQPFVKKEMRVMKTETNAWWRPLPLTVLIAVAMAFFQPLLRNAYVNESWRNTATTFPTPDGIVESRPSRRWRE